METVRREIEFYVTRRGETPFLAWIDSLRDARARAKIKVRLDRMKLGNLGDCRHVGEGVFELRIDFGPGYRVYFGQVGGKIVVLLCGGDKGSQARDIREAQNYWKDYQERP